MEHVSRSFFMRDDLDIVVVDDDRIAQMIIRKTLDKFPEVGTVHLFNDGMEALQALQRRWASDKTLPDLILLDLNMPVLNGWGFIDELKKELDWPLIPVVLVTSSVDPDDINRSKTTPQVEGFLYKPLRAGQLKEVLQKLV